MIRKLFLGTIYSIITFCVISYASVMVSLFSTVGNLEARPVCNVGFPFNYYYQFWAGHSDSPNCGWQEGNFLYDCLITWLVCTAIYIVITRRKLKAEIIS